MADQVGIVTRYFKHEVSRAALQLAEIAENLGMRPTILAGPVCRKEVSPHWDSRVIDARKADFREWALGCSHVIWTAPPPARDVLWCREHGIETVLLVVWDELLPHHKHAVCCIDSLVFPHRCACEAVCRRWSSADTHFYPYIAPWSAPLPICENATGSGGSTLSIFLPLHDSQTGRSDLEVLSIGEHIVRSVPDVRFTISSGAQWTLQALRRVRTLCKRYPERFIRVVKPNLVRQVGLYGTSQLVLWPAKHEGLATVGLMALHMGVPVLAWDIPPQNEYLRAKENAILVPCNMRSNWLGVPQAMPDWRRFLQHTLMLLQSRRVLRRMKQHTDIGLQARKQMFQQTWEKVLSR